MAGILFWAEGDAVAFNSGKWPLLPQSHRCDKTAPAFGPGLPNSVLRSLKKRSTLLAWPSGKEEGWIVLGWVFVSGVLGQGVWWGVFEKRGCGDRKKVLQML